MNLNTNLARAYRQSTAHSATPVGLVLLLYDTALDSLHRSLRTLAEENIEQRTAELNHAMAVIGELQASLDFERGGEVARKLERFYDFARGKIMEAHIKVSEEILRQLVAQFLSMREAWQQVEREVAGSPAPARNVPETLPSQPSGVSVEEPVGSHWSA